MKQQSNMAMNGFLLLQCLSFIFFLNISSLRGAAIHEDRELYIVYMGSLPSDKYVTAALHQSILEQVVDSSISVEDLMVRSYHRSFNGFAAKLTDQERQTLAGMNGVVSVFPSTYLQLHTTRSWDFMGLKESTPRKPSVESDTIVGVLDTGIWAGSESFSDEGFGPVPKKWKGGCKGGPSFTCNKKIVGARSYTSDTANDEEGHGTHTASTVAGNEVKNASFFGVGQGTARGGVPSARIAVYKVCSAEGCDSASLLAAFDDSIADGVDIITISIGGQSPNDFTVDPIAIGAFHATANGILVVNSAGNSGPSPGSTSSVAPWLFSVAASTTDRLFVDKVVLGNGKTFVGTAVNTFAPNGEKLPLVYGKEVSDSCEESLAQGCSEQCLTSTLVKGKIVICQALGGFSEVNRAGGAGAVLLDTLDKVGVTVSLPAVALSGANLTSVVSYHDSEESPVATISKTESIKDSGAPVVIGFSSRGPNGIVPDILKPDISGPGVDILAAYPPDSPLTGDPKDKRRSKYHILSGTSMSCPHVAGAAAFVKTVHPQWSPSAIKSAIMTTALPMKSSRNKDAEFAYGAGHVDPIKAINPGLVYETSKADYVKFLCDIGYTTAQVRAISGDNSSCPTSSSKRGSPKDLNYPSLAAQVRDGSFTFSFSRTVTNVGNANSTYKSKILQSSKLTIKVVPEVLSFKALNETKPFVVKVSGQGLSPETLVSAALVWSDGVHTVRSPISIYSP